MMITNCPYWSPKTRYTITKIMVINFCHIFRYQNNDQRRYLVEIFKFITKIMITNDSSIIHYQDNANEGFLGRLITGNDHSGHDHIHYLQRLGHITDTPRLQTQHTITSDKPTRFIKHPFFQKWLRHFFTPYFLYFRLTSSIESRVAFCH